MPQELTVRNSTRMDAVCTWSDELNCYLDYLSVMPMSEIKQHYERDEVGNVVDVPTVRAPMTSRGFLGDK